MNLRQWVYDNGGVAALAQQLDVPRMTVYRWMTGARMPRPAMMARIVAATGGAVTPADFYPPAPALLQETGKQELAA
jgi:DNA-binding transcriptional regulator YdaS (Cro superfamily)